MTKKRINPCNLHVPITIQQNVEKNARFCETLDYPLEFFFLIVLIYFSPAMKSKVLNQMAGCLNPGGYLLLGASESLTGLTDKFDMVRCNPGIIYKLK